MATTCDVEETTNVSLSDVINICSEGGFEAFLDMLAERIGHPLLCEIDYEIVELNEDKSLKFKVTGSTEMKEALDGEDHPPAP